MRPLICFIFPLLLLTVAHAQQSTPPPLEFDTGRPKPALKGFPVLGSGLAMSGGYYRGMPVGDMEGWTVSLWIRPNSESHGEIFNVVLDEKKGQALRIGHEPAGLYFSGPGRRDSPDWKLSIDSEVAPAQWHQVVMTFSINNGAAFYLNGELVGEGQRGWVNGPTTFANYHFGTGLKENGKLDHWFNGLIDDFTLLDRPLTEEEVAEFHEGKEFSRSIVTFNDFENVNHRSLAFFSESDRDESYLSEGKVLYETHCIQCHSPDGIQPPLNPLSRQFTKHEMENGGDPFSMFQTLTYGFRNMMPAVQVGPEDRYKVIHYLREEIIRKQAPELYVGVNETYTDIMPESPEVSGEEAARVLALARTGYLRDFGRALISPVNGKSPANSSNNALTIDLGNGFTISYDLGSMRSIGIWKGGFLDVENSLHHKLRAPGLPRSASFDLIPGSDYWQWAWDGGAEQQAPDLAPIAAWPESQIRYEGHYPWGDEIAISYRVQGRGILESPVLQDGVVHRRLTVLPGADPLEVIVHSGEEQASLIRRGLARIGNQAAWLLGDSSAKWRVAETGDLVLHLPESTEAYHLDVVLAEASDFTPKSLSMDLREMTEGGPTRWETTHTLKGELASSGFQGYALDSLPVPLKNAYNTWMRTSCLTFFPDGRLAVGTLSGDIWMVSGIDEDLDAVTWKRFAAGLYEPMGMKVVDDVLTVITRGRIVKLHDMNQDGEADFYEAFFNEPEMDKGWHAYNFDLEVGDDGSFYYARVGGFSEWSVPGGLVKVTPDGKDWHLHGVGMRVPNGIGRLPDGRMTFGDNQGTFVPASKISISRPGDFHGAGKWPDREGVYDPTDIVEPMLYMPQELDSSSGGQLWVEEDERFGPLSGQYFHTSYGRARIIQVLMDNLENGTTQAAGWPLPLTMESGTMRITRNPIDGQIYTSGLTGWQAGATREGAIQRLRFTGEEGIYLEKAEARQDRLELTFNETVDAESLLNTEVWSAEAWNYKWSDRYGSPHFKVSNPEEQGLDELTISSLELKDGGKTVVVGISDLSPSHTLKLNFQVAGQNGGLLEGPVYFTIHALPN